VLTFFSHLECAVPCGAGPYDPRKLHQRCTCGAPLLARYDLTAAKRWPKSALAGREASMWRYREILPLVSSEKGVDAPITLGEGWTPLLRVRRLGKALGLDRVFIKDESLNPTGSMKARGLAAAVTRALHMGLRVLAMPTSGPAGPAVSAYASRAGLDARVFVPGDARTSFIRDCELSGAVVTKVDGDLSEAATAALEKSRSHSWYHLGPFHEPYRIEGEKTMGYELAEQFGWQLPDWVCYPAGAGLGVVALWKAFAEMASLGWIDPVRRPHLVIAQAAGCAPLVRAHGSGVDKATRWENPQTIADGLRVPDTLGDTLALRAVRESNGVPVSVGDAEIVAAMKEAGQFEGLSASPESGAAIHAIRVLAGEGRIRPHDTVVIFNTASGTRYHELFATS